jgi:hypothetical protein
MPSRRTSDVGTGVVRVRRRDLASLLEFQLGDELSDDLDEGLERGQVAVEAPSLVDLAAVSTRDAFGLLDDAALANSGLAADDDQRGRDLVARLGRPGPKAAVQDVVDQLLLSCAADESGDRQPRP